MKNFRKGVIFTVVALMILITSATNSWAKELPGEKKFKDVKSTNWFNSTVTKLVDMGGIDGYPDKTFKPNNTITAAEFIKITVGSLGYNEKAGTGKDWAINYINKAMEIGLIDKGEFKEGEFSKPISRNKMAKILVKSVEHRKEELPGDYKEYEKFISDFKTIPEAYKDYVLKAYSRELLAGSNSKGDFKGDSNLTRAEAATVIIRIFDETERVNVKDIGNKETGPNADLRKVPIVGKGMVEIEGPQGEENPHNVDFAYLIRGYKLLDETYMDIEPQYLDIENLLVARFGNSKVIEEIMNYLKSGTEPEKELWNRNTIPQKRWTINGQLISVGSGYQTKYITVWRAE